jgi:hypothetical protein
MIDETGNIYGRLVVLGTNGETTKHKRLLWLCKCSCGTEKVIEGRNLRRGFVKSCGCLQRQISRRKYNHARNHVWCRSPLDTIDEDIIG